MASHKKQIVENCRIRLSASELLKSGLLEGTKHCHVETDHFRVHVIAYPQENNAYRLLLEKHQGPEPHYVNQEVTVIIPPPSPQHRLTGCSLGFICPICPQTDSKGLVKHLYIPPGKNFFACRHCHNLSYKKRQARRKSPIERLQTALKQAGL